MTDPAGAIGTPRRPRWARRGLARGHMQSPHEDVLKGEMMTNPRRRGPARRAVPLLRPSVPDVCAEPSLPRWLIGLAWASLALAVVVLFGLFPLTGGDLVHHLVMGQFTWTNGWVPTIDVFTFIQPGKPFIAHSWLAELTF